MVNTAKPLPRCPVEVTLSLIDGRWRVLILRELLFGTKRFGAIRKALGNVSTKVLTTNLRAMEENGLLTRHVYPEVPPKVEYTLTDLGQSLKPILSAMVEWGSNYKNLVEGQMPMRTNHGKVLLIMRAEQVDIQEIFELHRLVCQNGSSFKMLEEIERDNKDGYLLKAIDEYDKIVGVIGGHTEHDTLRITLLAVHPRFQMQEIDAKLLEEIERIYPDKSCSTSFLL